MKQRAESIFTLQAWDEQPYAEFDGRKLTRAHVRKSFRGDLAGESTIEYLMLYREDGSASFIGMEYVVGQIGARAGSFVLEHRGTFENGVARATWQVVPGSGTAALRGLRGEGASALEHASAYGFALEYDFEETQ